MLKILALYVLMKIIIFNISFGGKKKIVASTFSNLNLFLSGIFVPKMQF